ncbi:plasmid recombination protein [Nostocales cyanobacterium LEGE 11386]|nr:plasmid recombination protein [Nostocales cyanobacterium LEGE 11386]
MVALAILRVEKLKSFGNIGGSEKHTARLQDTPNADPVKENIRLIGECDERSLLEVVKDKITSQTKYKPRKDSVLCSEIFLSASPEYFRPDDPSRAGEWDNQRMLDFANASKNWLLENYGDKCVRAELHLDEATPHIHAYVVPVNEKTKRLSYKEMFGGSQGQGRIKLSKLQDSYAQALAPLGIERGIKGSNATHTKVKEYYQAVNSKPLSLELERFAPLPGETAQQLLDRIKNDKRILDLDHQLADRRRMIELEKRASQKAIASEKLRQHLGRRLLEQEKENLLWKQQAEQLRDLPLEDVAWQLGLDRDRDQSKRWRGHGHIMKIDGSKFYDFHPNVQKGGGGAIDLVMHVNECNYRQAIAWLNERFGEVGMQRSVTHHAREQAQKIAQVEPKPQFVPPVKEQAHWQAVQNYLTQKRGLLPNFVQALHERGFVYADEQQNTVFLMRNLNGETTGAFLRGTRGEDNTFKGYERGTKRTDGWFYFCLSGQPQDKIQRAVLCKSPIEALSLATLELEIQQGLPLARTMYMAVDSPKSLPVEFLNTVPHVEVDYDNDHAGDETARMIMEQLHHAIRVKPKGKDWNDTLCARGRQQLQQRHIQQQER